MRVAATTYPQKVTYRFQGRLAPPTLAYVAKTGGATYFAKEAIMPNPYDVQGVYTP